MKHSDVFDPYFLSKCLYCSFLTEFLRKWSFIRTKIIFILEPPPYFPQVVWSEQIAGNIALLSGSEGRWLRKGAASG